MLVKSSLNRTPLVIACFRRVGFAAAHDASAHYTKLLARALRVAARARS